jgi:hypothetical protein
LREVQIQNQFLLSSLLKGLTKQLDYFLLSKSEWRLPRKSFRPSTHPQSEFARFRWAGARWLERSQKFGVLFRNLERPKDTISLAPISLCARKFPSID